MIATENPAHEHPRVPDPVFHLAAASTALRLVGELAADAMRNRNTFFRGTFDDADRLIACEKVVWRRGGMTRCSTTGRQELARCHRRYMARPTSWNSSA